MTNTAFACSLDPQGVYEATGRILFIGAATSDSLSARLPHDFQYLRREAFTLKPPPFAQVIQVERLSSRAPGDLKKAIDANNGHVLLVPWAYGPDCKPTSWTWGALWTKPGQRGVFSASLRARDRWENGVPTLDVTAPWHVPYPTATELRLRARQPSLSPDDFLSMYDSIPPRDFRKRHDSVHDAALVKWAERHPDLASRYPLVDMVSSAQYTGLIAPFEGRESPVAGTYRFVLELAGVDSLIFFGRTELRSEGLIWRENSAHDAQHRPIDNPYGYYLVVRLAKDLTGLPIGFADPETQGYLAASFDPLISGSDSTVWSGGAELIRAAAGIVDNKELKARLHAIDEESFAALGRAPDYTPGKFVRRADGSVTLNVDVRGATKPIATVRGERLSATTLKDAEDHRVSRDER